MATQVLERALVAGPTGLARGLVAPLQLQLTASDRLRVNYVASDVNAAQPFLQLNYRILTPEGNITVGQELIAITTDFAAHSVDLPLRDGFLLALVVRSAVTAIYGTIFVSAYVYNLQGGGFDLGAASDLILAPLVQGFPTSQAALTWPGSLFVNAGEPAWYQRRINVNSPGAGTQWAYVVGGGREQEVLCVSALFTASADPANRFPIIAFLDDTLFQYFNVPRVPVITAGQIIRCVWAPGTGHDQVLTSDTFVDSLPAFFRIQPSFRIISGCIGMQAGDAWTQIQITVRERLNLA